MAETAVLATLGWVASPLVKMLIDKGIELLGTSVDEKTKTLAATTLPRLYLAIEKAEKSSKKHMVEDWLKRLKHAYYQAEDAVDLLEYQQLHLKVMEDRKTLTKSLKSKAEKLIRDVSENLTGHINKIIEISKEAGEFSDLLKELENDSSTSNPDRETTAEPLDKVFGLENDKKTVVDFLTGDIKKNSGPMPTDILKFQKKEKKNSGPQKDIIKNSGPMPTGSLKFQKKKKKNSGPQKDIKKNSDQAQEVEPSTRSAIPMKIIAIRGFSGIGKTTLAQHVCQDIKEQKWFDLVLWVHTPRKFMAIDVVKKIIQTIQKKNDATDKGNYDSSAPLEALREQMQGMLGSKKYLLVLDDFWCDDKNFIKQWEKFISCLRGWSPGSKILLTTQYKLVEEQVSLAETEVTTHTLGELTEDQLLKLLMHHAWPSNRPIPREKFEKIGRDIVSKLKGDPGATKMVGKQLRNKPDIKEWENWSKVDQMEARIWSYQQLPVHLQRCFAFCSLFPKGFEFPVLFLIRLWMAEGFINPIDEDIGENYINELVSLFFLEIYVDDGYIYCQLHDLFYDLAEQVKGDDFVRIDHTNTKNVLEGIKQNLSQRHENIRHISLPGSMLIKLKDEISLMKNLCTLLCVESDLAIPNKDLQEILENLKKLRVLYLPSCGGDLPNSIENLKHLRYLYFVDSSLSLYEFPNSMCKLYLLQTLYLPGCQSLPKEFSQLISLRHIFVKKETMSHVFDIGRLTSLQRLNKFNIRKETGYELHQLENLNQLKGTLFIAGLENVTDIDDAKKANLKSKGRLEKLKFHWSSDERVTNNDIELLGALQPHSDIIGLKVKGFRGNKFPNWFLGQNSTLKYLVDLQLKDCSNIKEISSIDISLPECKVLCLSGLNNLEKLPLLPPKLTRLILSHIPHLSYFSKNDLSTKEERKEHMLEVSRQTKEYLKSGYELELPQVVEKAIRRYLQMVNARCENTFQVMRNMDSQNELLDAMNICMQWHFEAMLNKNVESKLILPHSLTQLAIDSCSITDDALSTCIKCLHSLSELELVEIHTITSLPPQEALSHLDKLYSLRIESCFLLSSLGGISALSSLTELTLIGCLNLDKLNKLPSSVKILYFVECACVHDIINQSDLHLLCFLRVQEFYKIGSNCEMHGEGVLNVGHLQSLQEIVYGCNYDMHLEGLNSLTSLDKLEIQNMIRVSSPTDKCSIPIKKVRVRFDPLWLKEILSAQTFSSIESLRVDLFDENSMDDEMFQSLTSLKALYLKDCYITHLPLQLKNLSSLVYLRLVNCPKLHEMESFPNNLSYLHIKNCPILSAKFNNYDDSYEVDVSDGETLVKFRNDQTMPGPSQPTQEASTSQPTRQGLRFRIPRLFRRTR